jgi:hypothetical protein
MRRVITSIALLVLVGGAAALAQNGSSGGSSTAVKNQGQPQRDAPIGHRQPRAGDLSSEKNVADPNDALSKENALLDKKIRGICRGC